MGVGEAKVGTQGPPFTLPPRKPLRPTEATLSSQRGCGVRVPDITEGGRGGNGETTRPQAHGFILAVLETPSTRPNDS